MPPVADPRIDRPRIPAAHGMTAATYARQGAIAIRPRKVVAWTEFTADPTRFRFETDEH